MRRLVPAKPRIKQVSPGIIPEASCFRLDNDLPVYLIEAGSEDIVRLEFSFNAGNIKEYIPLLASSTNMMLAEGTRNYSSVKINKTLDYHGAIFNLYAERDRAGIVICFLNKHFEKILELLREMLFYPAFHENDLRALMNKRLQQYLISREKVNTIAIDQFFNSIFGNHHPYGRMILKDDFKNMNPLMLRDFHSGHYTVNGSAVIISGSVHEDIIPKLNYYFGEIHTPSAYIEESVNHLEKATEKRIHIEKPDAVQTSIMIGSPVINKRHADYPGLKFLNVILGGYFGSRLMKNLREDKGYTYGITSFVSSFNLSGYKLISAEVSKKSTQKAVDEIYREIRLLQSVPVEKEELEIVKNYMLGDMVRMFDGMFALAECFRSAWDFGLDNTYYYRFAEKIKSIEPDEIISLAQTYYNIDDLYEITAG